MLRRHFPPIILSETIWEGVVTLRGRKIGLSLAEFEMKAKQPKPASDLSKIGMDLVATRILAVPHHVTRALEWMQLARASPVRVDIFAHLWFALVALCYGQPQRGDMKKALAYLTQLRSGAGGHAVFSRARVDQLESLFRRAE